MVTRLLAAAGLVVIFALGGLAPARAAEPGPAPLRLVPREADAFIEVPHPRKLLESLDTLEAARVLRTLPPVREALESTNARRFQQLVAHFEKQLGRPWPQLLDRLARGGAVLALKFGDDPAPALLVIQGTDEDLARRFFAEAVTVLGQELERQEAKERPRKRAYRDCEAVSVGDDFHMARAGSALLVSNKEVAVKMALDLFKDGGDAHLAASQDVAEARKAQPADALAWAHLNMERVKETPGARELYSSPRDNAILTVLFGGWIDVLGRAPHVTAALARRGQEVRAEVRLPRGREGGGTDLLVHAPPASRDGTLPLLEPQGILMSSSFYLDLGKFWDERARLFNAATVQQFEKADKDASPVLLGARPSKLLPQAGPHHRLVVVNQPKAGYTRQPKQNLPAFAFVMDMRQPDEFGPSMEAVLRGAALLATSQVKLKMQEEKVGDYALVGYRFPEKGTLAEDPEDARFNFSPCFARVGRQFLFCSTMELGREMVEILAREGAGADPKLAPEAVVTRVYGPGAADALAQTRDALVTQAVLGQAVPVDEARAQVDTLIALVRRLGDARMTTTYRDRELRQDIILSPGR